MRRLITFSIAVLFSVVIIAQGIGVGTNTPASSAQLDISSTNKGFLPPRMTAVQRDSIESPVAGLIVYCTNCGSSGEMEYYNGSSWRNMIGWPAALPPVGQQYRGGILSYILQPGDAGYDPNVPHGFIAASTDQSTGIAWDNGQHEHVQAISQAIGSGNANTNMIVTRHGAGNYAAKLCADLVLNGYSDWYLPSLGELQMMVGIVGMENTNEYWSSTETLNGIPENAFFVWLYFGDYGEISKSSLLRVRAIRSF
jgi:hypothetical protein